MFVTSGIWCLANVLSISPSLEQTKGLWGNQCLQSCKLLVINLCRSKSYVLPLVEISSI